MAAKLLCSWSDEWEQHRWEQSRTEIGTYVGSTGDKFGLKWERASSQEMASEMIWTALVQTNLPLLQDHYDVRNDMAVRETAYNPQDADSIVEEHICEERNGEVVRSYGWCSCETVSEMEWVS
jgi:hypothetical protein